MANIKEEILPDNPQDEGTIQIQNLDDDEGVEKGEAPAAPEREKWGSKLSYLLTLVGYAVGFGNIWRFPYQVRENGGLVYLIPYFTMLAIIGIPIFFLELAVGQRRRKGVVYAWAEVSPRLGGIGIACAWICFMVGLYYNTLIAYCLSYLFDSFRNPLPWTSCAQIGKYADNTEYTRECQGPVGDRATKYYWFRRTLDVSPDYQTAGNFSWWLFMYIGISWAVIYAILIKGTESVGAAVYFTAVFPYVVLIIFFISNLIIEPAKGWLGAYRLVKPNWKFIYNPVTWLKAGSQIFFSLGLAEGCLVVFASYNPARNNCHKDAVYISIINCATSAFAALVVFPMIGLLGHRKYDGCIEETAKLFTGKFKEDFLKAGTEDKYDIYFFTKAKLWKDVDEMAKNISVVYRYGELSDDDKADYRIKNDDYKLLLQDLDFKTIPKNDEVVDLLRDCSIGQEATASGGGTGFVFMGFTEAVLHLKGSNFWSVLFFFMLLTLGLDSGFGSVEGLIDALVELVHFKRLTATTISCVISAFFSLILFSFGWGMYILDLLDQYTANWTLLVIAFLECYAVAWDYGLAKIAYDVLLMTGSKPNLYMLLCWKYVAPTVIALMLIGSIIEYIYTAVVGNAQFIDAIWSGRVRYQSTPITKAYNILEYRMSESSLHCVDKLCNGLKYDAFNPKHKDSKDGIVELVFPTYAIVVGFLLMIFCIVWVPIQMILRRTKFSMLKEQAPAEFPEEELREERNINVEKEEEHFTSTEKVIMGSTSLMSLQEYRDNVSLRRSRSSLDVKGLNTK